MDFVKLAKFLSQLPARTAMFWVAIIGAFVVPGWFAVIFLPNSLVTVVDRLVTAAAFGLLSLMVGITFAFLVVNESFAEKQTEAPPDPEEKQTLIATTATVSAVVIPMLTLVGVLFANIMRLRIPEFPALGLGSYFMSIMLFTMFNAMRYVWNTRHRHESRTPKETETPPSHPS